MMNLMQINSQFIAVSGSVYAISASRTRQMKPVSFITCGDLNF